MKSVVLYNSTHEADRQAYLQEVIRGLSKPQKELPFKFVYDDEGSRLITLINSTEVYYIWKCEHQIFETHGLNMLQMMGSQKFNLIDLGAGDASKTQILLHKALEQKVDFQYIPMDISYASNEGLMRLFAEELPDLKMTALTSQFEEGIQWVHQNKHEKNVFLFVGATIGNASQEENLRFVQHLGKHMKTGDQIFVGFDKMKSAQTITRAYLDNGYEERFLMNSLKRLNTELRCDFNLDKFEAFPYFDPLRRSMQFVLISQEEQQVSIGDQVIKIAEAEVIKAGQSRKWLEKEALELFRAGGLNKMGIFEDGKHYFSYIVFQKQ